MAICEGLNVMEMGAGSTGASIAGMVLADAGARVLKVESPNGDRLRTLLPSGFTVWNRGKESLVADLRTKEGRSAVLAFAKAADVVIDGFAPGTSEDWGVGASELRKANPSLIHCAITGFGTSGPYSSLKGYEALVAAKVGLFARGSFGYRDGPIMLPVPWGGFGAAMQAVAGILGALLVRDRTGRGQRIEATMVGGIDPTDYFMATIIQLMHKQGQQGSMDAKGSTAGSRYAVLVATRDGRFIQTSTLLPHQAAALIRVAGLESTMADSRFARMPSFDTPEIADEWEGLLWEAFRKENLSYWMPRLAAESDVAFEIAGTSEEGLDHPQILHNGDVVVVEDPALGAVRQVGPIGHFSASPLSVLRSAPALGENGGGFQSASTVPATGEKTSHPLSGTTIVEFGFFYAMPYALAMAAALGARVIKLEDRAGDPHRNNFGSEIGSSKTTIGKQSVSIDLRTEEGRAIAQRLVASADVFVTGFRAGVADRLGLGHEELRTLNQRLLYVHAAGYGSDGPYAGRALYAAAAQAVGGSFGRQVAFWADPANNLGMSVMELRAVVAPRLGQVTDGDSNAALALLAALTLGIYHQRRTGIGQHLSTSMIGANAWAYSDDFCSYAGKPPVARCDSEYYGISALYRLYEAAAGTWVCLAVTTDEEWKALVSAIGIDVLADQDSFGDAQRRADNDALLIDVLGRRFLERTALEWESELTAAGVGCVAASMAGHPSFISFDPVLRETGLMVEIDHPAFGSLWVGAPPVAMSETPGVTGLPCVRGQHNHLVLEELGYSAEETKAFEAAGVVIPAT